jgi:transposase
MRHAQETALEFAAYIGLDWAHEAHAISLRAADSHEVEQYTIKHQPAALAEWVSNLRQRFGGRPIAVALEQARGPLVYALMHYDFLVLFPVNPKMLAKYREAFRLAGAKDDPADADLLRELVTLHRDKLRAWHPDDEQTRLLMLLVEHRRQLSKEQTRLTNRLKELLKLYYPHALSCVGELKTLLACDFLQRWPSLHAAQAASEVELHQFYQAHHCRRSSLIERRVAELKIAQPLTQDQAVITAAVAWVEVITNQLRVVLAGIAKFDVQIAELFASHPDQELFSSFPGAGAVLAPRLLTAMGTDRGRFGTAQQVQEFAGTAPVTERSGKSCWVHWRWACPKFVRQSFHEFAGQSVRFSVWAKAFYQQQRQRGKGHHAALRSLANRWIRIIYRCWQTRQPYCEETYSQALRRRRSPLSKVIQPT